MAAATSQSPNRPNVLLIMSDEQRWDSLGCNGNRAAHTPHIDALAHRGASFDHCYVTYPLCCPSRMSLWTGLMPHDHHGLGNWRWLRADLRDRGLVRPFADHGYHTIYCGKWHVPGTTPSRMGFADTGAIPAVLNGRDRGRYIEEYRQYATAQGYQLVPGHIENLTPSDVVQPEDPNTAHYGTAEIALEHFLETWQTTRFLEQLDRRPEDRPFFAVCSFNAPHFPMIVPEPYDRLIDPDAIDLSPGFCNGLEGKPREVIESPYHVTDWSEREWRRLIAHYHGLCALVDAQVGRVLDRLDATGELDNTIVVFTSDHGDMLGAHCLNKKGYPLHYEEALRVPLVMDGPGIEPGARVEALVSLMDLVPTLAELCGVELDVAHEGIPFARAVTGQGGWEGRPWVISESFHVGGTESGRGEPADPAVLDLERDGVNVSIRTATHRYIYRLHDHDELYELGSDPYELSNLAGSPEHRSRIDELRHIIATSLDSAVPAVAARIRSSSGERMATDSGGKGADSG